MELPDRIEVEVTAEDIAAGRVDDCRHCPVAIATARAGGRERAWVGGGCIGFYDESEDNGPVFEAAWRQPAAVREFIDRFDEGGTVEPFSFALEPAGRVV